MFKMVMRIRLFLSSETIDIEQKKVDFVIESKRAENKNKLA